MANRLSEVVMRLLGMMLLALVVALPGALVRADQLTGDDPQVKTGGSGLLPLGDAPPVTIDSTSFSIFSSTGSSPGSSPCVRNERGGSKSSPNCLFENAITGNTSNAPGATIIMFTFEVALNGNGKVKCGFLEGSPFSMCDVQQSKGDATVTFFGGSIPFGTDFTLDFEGFGAKSTFVAQATVPEPGTLGFLAVGIGALLIGRRRRVSTPRL
jgi:PEP-CTERM motif